ncbi:unnamed protein product [Tetraodon nigroviridis]|uniref:(spotted green pufferfish) hypothetical protein n=1 Tax=Tetraodon nigroviridis TaxID=99883 RepID=Q4SA01_TETNG|nr:unnamed protein product [Tetraodon nigroviridis]
MDFERGIWSAALHGDLQRVRSLVQKGTQPNLKDTAGYTALHYASGGGHVAVCAFLLEVGACASPQTPGGATRCIALLTADTWTWSGCCWSMEPTPVSATAMEPPRCIRLQREATGRCVGSSCRAARRSAASQTTNCSCRNQLAPPQGGLQELLRPPL